MAFAPSVEPTYKHKVSTWYNIRGRGIRGGGSDMYVRRPALRGYGCTHLGVFKPPR